VDEVTPVVRWTLVVALAVTLVGVPTAFAHRPASGSGTTAAELRDRIDRAGGTAYAGYVETRGSLPLPEARGFADVTSLFADSSRLRVWWASADRWRVDTLSDTGETDLVADGDDLVRWEYDGQEVTRFTEPAARLPRASDVLPPRLAQQALAGVSEDELSTLPATRVAGRDALGLRVTPTTPGTTIGHVDIWSDRETGLPLRVKLYAVGAGDPAFATELVSLDLRTPSAATIRFEPPPGAEVHVGDVVDLADAADRFAPYVFPSELVGLPRSSDDQRGVGIYRRGPTWMIAMPMLERVAEPLKDQLRVTPGSAEDRQGVFARLGPLSVLVTSHDGFDSHTLIAGTVTRDRLRQAARFLAHGGYVRGRDGAR
jgi:outer membrane lipoprotein-sorting protein